MACERITFGDGTTGFICGRGSRPAASCEEPGCTTPHVALCDWPVPGKRRRTCSRRLCAAHARALGDDLHLCPEHGRDFHPAPARLSCTTTSNGAPALVDYCDGRCEA